MVPTIYTKPKSMVSKLPLTMTHPQETQSQVHLKLATQVKNFQSSKLKVTFVIHMQQNIILNNERFAQTGEYTQFSRHRITPLFWKIAGYAWVDTKRHYFSLFPVLIDQSWTRIDVIWQESSLLRLFEKCFDAVVFRLLYENVDRFVALSLWPVDEVLIVEHNGFFVPFAVSDSNQTRH